LECYLSRRGEEERGGKKKKKEKIFFLSSKIEMWIKGKGKEKRDPPFSSLFSGERGREIEERKESDFSLYRKCKGKRGKKKKRALPCTYLKGERREKKRKESGPRIEGQNRSKQETM